MLMFFVGPSEMEAAAVPAVETASDQLRIIKFIFR
jgi:hypothetical protein